TLSTQVSPADLSVSVSTQTDPMLAGSPLTFTATVINGGPSLAPGVQYFQSLPANSRFVSISSSQGSLSYSNGQILGSLGDLATNGSATITLVVVPLSGGSATSTASVSSGVIDSNSANNVASAAATVTNQPGSIAFDSILYQTPENGGYAALTLTRTGGTQGSVSVVYTTVANASAQPGVNFTPVSQVVTFADGETSKTVFVPVSADGTYESYTSLQVVLSEPTGGASLGDPSTTTLAIMNTDVDLQPLQVASTTLIASGSTINGVQVAFNKPLDPLSAASLTNFFLIGPGGQGLLTFPPIYNPANNSVTIVPAAPLTTPGFYTLVINADANGLHDYHGTILDGNNDGLAGGNFVESFARGTSLAYGDATGNLVSLSLSRGGLLEMFRDASGNATRLNILPPVSGRSTLFGNVQKVGASATGTTNLGVVTGLSLPGPVRSGLTTPPFYVQSLVNSTTASGAVHRPHRGQTRVAGVHLPRWFHRTI
ncbi:MAG TPA: Calx-beta domain-containing protein, partial [Isosphaeraceae bacterium]|nr:Calx-beta domain-containing protein [Isosphaeraceae bacterium]